MSEQKSSRKKGSDESRSSGTTAVGSDGSKITTTNPDKADPLPRVCPPSDLEARLFYFGLPSLPRLVGRASAGKVMWESPEEQFARMPAVDGYRVADKKTLGAIGAHRIIDVWGRVRPEIIAAIGHLPWTSIDVFRIGSVDTTLLERPVVVWIGLDLGQGETKDPLPWEDIAHALRSCQRVFDKFGIGDADCQMRESRIVSLAGPRLLEPLPEPFTTWHYLAQKFATSIGQSVSPFERPTLSGTLSIYLSPESGTDDNRPLWGLTCRHVAVPTRDNKDYQFDGGQRKEVGLNSAPNAKKWISYLLELRNEHANSSMAADVDELYQSVKDFEFDEGRKIGHVLLAPPIGQGFTPIPWTRDWCLVDLDRSKFPNDACPTNAVDIRTDMPRSVLLQLLNPQPSGYVFKFPPNGLLRISGIIPLAEVGNPKTLDKNGEEALLVGKRGAVTGLTWGCPSELESVVRQCMPDGSEFTSLEWAIHGSLEKKTIPFSAGGDSGAAIFDVQGRLGGFVTRGTDPNLGLSVDITYATPAELVLADIEAQLGQKVVVL